MPDDMALRDALVAECLRNFGIAAICHIPSTVALFANKWETSSWLRNIGVAVPKSFLISSDMISGRGVAYACYRDYLNSQAGKMCGSVIVKPLWDSMGTGMVIFKNGNEAIENVLKQDCPKDVMIEEFLPGQLFSMEVISNGSSVICQPLIAKATDRFGTLSPFGHVRFGPCRLPAATLEAVRHLVTEICMKISTFGSLEFELIRHESKFYIIEINPRVSEVTSLSSLASGLNSYLALCDIALNRTMRQPDVALPLMAEIPLTRQISLTSLVSEEKISPEYVSSVVYHDGSAQTKCLLPLRGAKSLLSSLRSLVSSGLVAGELFAELEVLISVLDLSV